MISPNQKLSTRTQQKIKITVWSHELFCPRYWPKKKAHRGFNLLKRKVNPIHILFAPYDHLEWVQNVVVRPLTSVIKFSIRKYQKRLPPYLQNRFTVLSVLFKMCHYSGINVMCDCGWFLQIPFPDMKMEKELYFLQPGTGRESWYIYLRLLLHSHSFNLR